MSKDKATARYPLRNRGYTVSPDLENHPDHPIDSDPSDTDSNITDLYWDQSTDSDPELEINMAGVDQIQGDLRELSANHAITDQRVQI